MRFFLAVVLVVVLCPTHSYPQSTPKVKWYTLEQAERLSKTKPKKILIDVYTDWCVWCKRMDAETFNHPEIASYLNEHFYPVKFNAESYDTVVFNGAKYINLNRSTRSTHPLAYSLLGWRLSYPSIVYFSEKLEYLGPMPGFKTAEQMEVIINYIGQDKYKSMSMESFEKTFTKKVKPQK